MTLPAAATKVNLDAATDDPKQARAELADHIDKFNALLTHLDLSPLTQTPATVGEALEIATGALRVKLNGATLTRSASGLAVNVGTGANQIPLLGAGGKLAVGTIPTGTGANQIPLLDGLGKLPAVDGSQLTGVPAVLTDGSVTQVKLAAAAVGQAQLKTTTGEVSTTSLSGVNLTLPGGGHGFYPQIRNNTAFQITAQIAAAAATVSYVTNIFMKTSNTVSAVFAQQRYVQASPPYDLGDGEVVGFVFALVGRDGLPVAFYMADEAPWIYNGPTDCSPDIVEPIYREAILRRTVTVETDRRGRRLRTPREETVVETINEVVGHRALKRLRLPKGIDLDAYFNGDIGPRKLAGTVWEETLIPCSALVHADMERVPHPFLSNDLAGLTPVLVDPQDEATRELARLSFLGVDIYEMFRRGRVRLDNEALPRSGPRGLMQVALK